MHRELEENTIPPIKVWKTVTKQKDGEINAYPTLFGKNNILNNSDNLNMWRMRIADELYKTSMIRMYIVTVYINIYMGVRLLATLFFLISFSLSLSLIS